MNWDEPVAERLTPALAALVHQLTARLAACRPRPLGPVQGGAVAPEALTEDGEIEAVRVLRPAVLPDECEPSFARLTVTAE